MIAIISMSITSCALLQKHADKSACFMNGCFSAREVAETVLAAVYEYDIQGLEKIAVSEDEYRSYVWPELPISSVKQWREHVDFVWEQHSRRSSLCMQSMLKKYGGNKYALKKVRYAEIPKHYGQVTVHRDARLIVSGKNKNERELNLFGSIVELNGTYKIMSYNTH